MRIAAGLPATIPRADGRLVLSWARQVDDCLLFSSLAVLDRIVFDNYEPLATLSAAAAVTSRVRLATSIVIAPLRSAALLAKQAATIQALSGDRLVLGLGLGARRDDYEITGTNYPRRGPHFTDQLAEMRAFWEEGEIGPHPEPKHGPQVLVGGGGGLAMSRMARYADGYIHGGGPPRAFLRSATEARAAWEDAGRPGKPELWGMAYFALGDDSSAGFDYLKNYYAFTGPFAEKIAAGLLTTREQLLELVHGYEEAGCDELILFPARASMEELNCLIDVIGGA